MKVVAMKLVSGEEIIGRVIEQDSVSVTMSHVRVVCLQQDQTGRYGVGMMDYIVSNKDCEITIDRDKAVTMFDASQEIEKAYLQNTSGIQLA